MKVHTSKQVNKSSSVWNSLYILLPSYFSSTYFICLIHYSLLKLGLCSLKNDEQTVSHRICQNAARRPLWCQARMHYGCCPHLHCCWSRGTRGRGNVTKSIYFSVISTKMLVVFDDQFNQILSVGSVRSAGSRMRIKVLRSDQGSIFTVLYIVYTIIYHYWWIKILIKIVWHNLSELCNKVTVRWK